MHFTGAEFFVLDSVIVKTPKTFSSHGGFINNAMYHHIETILSN